MCMYVPLPETFPFTSAPAQGSLGIAVEDGVSVMKFFLPLLCFVASAFFFGETMKKMRGEKKKGRYGSGRKCHCYVVELCKTVMEAASLLISAAGL